MRSKPTYLMILGPIYRAQAMERIKYYFKIFFNTLSKFSELNSTHLIAISASSFSNLKIGPKTPDAIG